MAAIHIGGLTLEANEKELRVSHKRYGKDSVQVLKKTDIISLSLALREKDGDIRRYQAAISLVGGGTIDLMQWTDHEPDPVAPGKFRGLAKQLGLAFVTE